MKSADFFDVEEFKEINFTGDRLIKIDESRYELHGELTMRGIKKKIKLDVEFGGVMKDPWGTIKQCSVSAEKLTGKIGD